MADYLWSDLNDNDVFGGGDANPPSFSADADRLIFDAGISAAAVSLDYSSGGISVFSYGGKTVTLNIDIAQFTSPANILFADGSVLLVGDNDTLTGGDNSPNTHTGTINDDRIIGLGSSDNLSGSFGADWLDGGAGFDILLGEAGDDTLLGGADGGNLVGGDGNDWLQTDGFGNLLGLNGNDTVLGSATGNYIEAGSGNDWVQGGNGNDQIYGGSNNDTLLGGGGADFIAQISAGIVDAGAGNDTIDGVGSAVTLTGDDSVGGGQDRYVLFTISPSSSAVADFEAGAGGDVLDVGSVLNGLQNYAGGNPFATGHFQLLQSGAQTLFQVDRDAAGASFIFQTLLTLQNVDADSLVGANFTPQTAPDGSPVPPVVFAGTESSDNVTGGVGNDTLSGLGSSDNLSGSFGADWLDGGAGFDILLGEAGDDTLLGGADGGNLVGGDGNDWLQTDGFGNLLGLNGNDTVLGSATGNYIEAGSGNDWVQGGNGNDQIYGGSNNDTLLGGGGADFIAQISAGIVDAGAGNDTIDGVGSAVTLTGDDSVGGGQDRYVLFTISPSSSAVADFEAGAGGDVLDVGSVLNGLQNYAGGNPFATGHFQLLQSGAQTLFQVDRDAAGASFIFQTLLTLQNVDADSLVGANFTPQTAPDGSPVPPVVFAGTESSDNVTGGVGNDTLSGLGSSDNLSGSFGADWLDGGAGFDILLGEAGDDTLLGGADGGNLVGGDGNDWLQTDGFGNLLGLNGNDTVLGSATGNYIEAGSGNDWVQGGNGNDQIYGGSNNDTLLGGGGADFIAQISAGIVDAGAGNDTIDGVGSAVTLTGDDSVGGGQDRYVLFTISPSSSAVADFEAGAGGDVLDVGSVLNGLQNYAGGNPFATGHFQLLQSGAQTLFQVDRDAAGASFIFQTLLTLQNVTGTTLTADNFSPGSVLPSVFGTGTSGNDLITGTPGVGNTLFGLGGNDTISGAGFGDTLDGGAEHDSLVGGGGNDNLVGGTGNDTLIGELGDDTLDGGAGDDSMVGGGDSDAYTVNAAGDVVIEYDGEGAADLVSSTLPHTLEDYVEQLRLIGVGVINGTGNSLANTITGNAQANRLEGREGNDTLNGGAGGDTLAGGLGDDFYVVDADTDVVEEIDDPAEGIDTVQAGVSFSLAGTGVENLVFTGNGAFNGTGSNRANVIVGNNGINVLAGLAEADSLNGGLASDTLDGGAANDTLDGGAGVDSLVGGLANDTYFVDFVGDLIVEASGAGQGATDTVLSSSLTYTLGDQVERLTLVEGSAAVSGTGNSQNNLLVGNSANNTLSGGVDGVDTMEGGLGNDTYIVDRAGDVVTELAGGGTADLIQSSATYTAPAEVENLTLTGIATINGTGNSLTNVLIGNALSNVLSGLDGNDTLDGGARFDTLDGGLGADSMVGGLANDVFIVDNAGDVVVEVSGGGQGSADHVQTSLVSYTLPDNVEILTLLTGAVNGTGNTLANTITGNGAVNVLDGGNGNDMLDGAAGADMLLGGANTDLLLYDAADTLVDGGGGNSDKLRLLGEDDLNLLGLAGSAIQNVEIVDLVAGAGVNELTLSFAEVLAMSGTTNILKIDGDTEDRLTLLDAGTWESGGTSGGYEVWTKGLAPLATLLVDPDIITNFP